MFEINIKEIPAFFSYLWARKRCEMITSLVIFFVLPTLPYIFISLKILGRKYADQISYFGDGSMISLCIGIICTYFGRTHDFKNDGEKNKHKLYNVVAVIIYIILILLFIECQLSTPRSKLFIWIIVTISLITLIFTSLFSLILNFDNYQDFQDYKQGARLKEAEASIELPSNSKTKIKV